MVKPSVLARLAGIASFFALGVIALGAFTRLIDAGLGCPDWPGCYGHLVAPVTAAGKDALALANPGASVILYKAWAEMVHRYFVGGLSLFILGIVMLIGWQRSLRTRANGLLAMTLIVLLVYQILLGQWTVTLKLLPLIVSQHLLGGFLILTILWLLHLQNNTALQARLVHVNTRGLQGLALAGWLLVLLQIALGAWVSTNYAALSCPDFPFCLSSHTMTWHFKAAFSLLSPVGVNYEGGVLPEVVRQTIQMTHRFGALIVTCYLVGFSVIAIPRVQASYELTKSIYLVLGLLGLQLGIGMTNVILKLPLITAISHNIVAVLLLLSLLSLLFKLNASARTT